MPRGCSTGSIFCDNICNRNLRGCAGGGCRQLLMSPAHIRHTILASAYRGQHLIQGASKKFNILYNVLHCTLWPA